MLLALLLATALHQSHPAPGRCNYIAKASRDVVARRGCAWLDSGGRIHVARAMLVDMAFSPRGLASVFLFQHWYLVGGDGIGRRVMTMDGFPEEPADGLYRSPQGNRIGFIDRSLRFVIPARYDGAYMFDHGRAAVCIGCRDASDGEHHWSQGGRWACIDRRGRTVVAYRTVKPGESLSGICDHRTSR
jgi:hypothetical protein